MSARHQDSDITYIRRSAIDPLNRAKDDLQRVINYGQPPVLPNVTMAGGGQSVGSGTNYPLQPPVIDLGTSSGPLTINLAQKNAHYQKVRLHDGGSAIVISFDGLPINKSVIFCLDITNDNTIAHGITWPANLFNIPSLSTSSGARYLLAIAGYRSGSETRYTVINSGVGGSSTLWSLVTIDVDKDMAGHGLSDLSFVNFRTTGNRVGLDTDGAGHIMNFYGDGKQLATLSRNAAGFNPGQTVMELIDSFSSGFPVAEKFFYAPATPATGDIGELDFDTYTSLNNQKTFAQIRGAAVDITDSGVIGRIKFYAGNGAGILAQVMNVEGGPSGSTPTGLNMLSHPIYDAGAIAFDIVGGTILEESDAIDFITANLAPGQTKFRFKNGLTTILEIGPAKIEPFTAMDVGSTSHFVNNVYLTDIFLIDTAHEIFVSGGDLVATIPHANVYRFRDGLNDKLQIDNNRNAISLRNGSFFEIQPSTGNPLQILKQAGSMTEFSCADGFQFDESIVASSSSNVYCGTFAQPFAGGAFLHGIAFLVSGSDPTATNIPQGFMLGWVNSNTGTIRIYMNYGGTLYYTSLTSHL